MFGLSENHLIFLKNTLLKYIENPQAKIYVFGSRATGKYREYSDIDIAIDSKDFNFDMLSELKSEFENSNFPYEVDILDLNKINENFKELIKGDLIQL